MSPRKLLIALLLVLSALAPQHLCASAEPAPQEQVQEQPAPPAVPTPPTTPLEEGPAISYETAFVKMLFTLGGLILVVFLTIWILRRLGQGKFRGFGGGKAIEILEKRPLSAKSMLYVVQVGAKRVLISESQLDVRTIASLEEVTEEQAD